jgi:hypothetical protein
MGIEGTDTPPPPPEKPERIDLSSVRSIEPVHGGAGDDATGNDQSRVELATSALGTREGGDVANVGDPGSSDGVPPSSADGLTAPGGTEIEGDPYTMRALFPAHLLSDFADDQPPSAKGLPTTGQDAATPNAEVSNRPADSADAAWPANSADVDAWYQLPKEVREGFRGEVRMEEFHDGIGRILGPDQSMDSQFWYRDGDAPENEETWRRDNAVLGQWNSGSSYVHLDDSEAPIKGWVGTTAGQHTEDGGWLPGGKEGIYIPPSEKLKLRDASVSGGKVPWRS